MSSNNAGHMNDGGRSYAQPPTPSERCNNLRAKNRALLEENDKLRATLAQWYQQPKGEPMSQELKTGDVVKLKSGGPKMTVRNRSALPVTNYTVASTQGWGATPIHSFVSPVTCDWFTSELCAPESKTYEENALELVTT